MYREDADALVQLGEAVRERARVLRQIEILKAEIAEGGREHHQLREQLLKEEADVAKLEGGSLTRIALTVIGRVEKRMEKERHEALVARLAAEAKALELEDLREEHESLRQRLAALEGAEERYREAFTLRVDEIRAKGGGAAERLESIVAEVVKERRLKVELHEAIDAGVGASRYLGVGLGVVDSILRAIEEHEAVLAAVIVTTVVTMSTDAGLEHRLEHALRGSARSLERFARELLDVPGGESAAAEFGPYRNFLSDYPAVVSLTEASRYQALRKKIEGVRDAVERVLRVLRREADEVRAREKSANERYRQFVEMS